MISTPVKHGIPIADGSKREDLDGREAIAEGVHQRPYFIEGVFNL